MLNVRKVVCRLNWHFLRYCSSQRENSDPDLVNDPGIRLKPAFTKARTDYFSKKWRPPEIYPTLKERLAEDDVTILDPELYKSVNIGLPEVHSDSLERQERAQRYKELRSDDALRKLAHTQQLKVDIDEVNRIWEITVGPEQIRELAEHYLIFEHLFGKAYFVPRVILRVSFDYDEDSITPVFWGNIIKPKEASAVPAVNFESSENDLWTLVLTNPDGDLKKNDSECLHWFVGNIKGNSLESGDVIVDYMQPFPPRGTGYHRFVFILYKQCKHADYSALKRKQPCQSLSERSFSTLEFYSRYQDNITPAGLVWFQSDWDATLTDFFHYTLNMKEPIYEYEFPKPYIAPQKWFPKKEPFNEYLDRYRDPRDISKDILLKRLAKVNPFKEEEPVLRYPNAVPLPDTLSKWERLEARKARLGFGRYRELYRGYNKPVNHTKNRGTPYI